MKTPIEQATHHLTQAIAWIEDPENEQDTELARALWAAQCALDHLGNREAARAARDETS